MKPGRLFWKLFLGNAGLIALVLVVCFWIVAREFGSLRDEDLRASLHDQAVVLRGAVESVWSIERGDELTAFVHGVAESLSPQARITLINTDGTVLADSKANRLEMHSHADRPEFQAALRDGLGEARRRSETLGYDLTYVAVRVGTAEAPRGVVRVAMPLLATFDRERTVWRLVGVIGLAALAAAVILALGIALLWGRRIAQLTAAATRLSRGDLDLRLTARGGDEIATLARVLNRLAQRVSDQLATADRQRRALESLLGQLTEGVIVVRSDGRIHLLNPAAERLLEVSRDLADKIRDGSDVPLEQAFPQHDLQRLLQTADENQPGDSAIAEARVEFDAAGGPRSLLARACSIHMPEAGGTGRLVVVTDVTELARAIRLRTDFAANASHELRTPLSAVRAAVETLARTDAAARDVDASRFLEVIVRHVTRLESLVNDLLDLSRVESPAARFETLPVNLLFVCDELQHRWSTSAAKRGIEWRVEQVGDTGSVRLSLQLLNLVLDNLVDNAIKFTNRGGRVVVHVQSEGDRLLFEVRDSGCGIPPEEHARVFERFYQVSPARTGTGSPTDQPRGTGLGLSIVKHAVAAMKGSLQLDSTPGNGTCMTVVLPASS